MDCDISCLICEKIIGFDNICLVCNEEKGYYPIYKSNISKYYNNETIIEGFYLDLITKINSWKKCYDKCERCDSKGNKTNMNCISCKENLNSDVILTIGNCMNICLNNTFITPDGDCILIFPNGTIQFSSNNSCLYNYPYNYEINNNKCIFKSFSPNISSSEFLNQIMNNITSYVNSSKVINGTNFLAMPLSSDKIAPEEQT